MIKEELIELSTTDVEAARINIENLSFVNHRLSFQFQCNECRFATIDRSVFEEHLIMHNDLEWTGFCLTCDAHVVGYDTDLQQEFNHMLKVHVKQSDMIVLGDETDKKMIQPLLKLRVLEGDHLSAKSFEKHIVPNSFE